MEQDEDIAFLLQQQGKLKKVEKLEKKLSKT